ncbi:hypothetical protein AQJ91_42825 [Streptomyces dysideae]|uniref:Ricin B lectin domain-containing protein n=1 Tax=Streptomyces dysideae TaxID=909626 RepID=A0A101UQT3_9ACTN|nr:hypothetical protein AQJ91_42825 [Streptomyces dysideae]
MPAHVVTDGVGVPAGVAQQPLHRPRPGQAGCLDAAGGNTANGTTVQMWTCHGGFNQVWQPYGGGYRNPASGRCLDVPGSSTTDGTRLVSWDCNGDSNQKWTTLTAG